MMYADYKEPKITINAPRFGNAVYADAIHVSINGKELHSYEAPDECSELAQHINAGKPVTREYVHELFKRFCENEWFVNEWNVLIEDAWTANAHYLVIQHIPGSAEYITQEWKPVTDALGIATGDYIISDHSTATLEYLETLEHPTLSSIKYEILAMVRHMCLYV